MKKSLNCKIRLIILIQIFVFDKIININQKEDKKNYANSTKAKIGY